jgi:hypothetical protein
MHTKSNDQTFAGVFFIGLAVLFLTNFWWPGILFVVGAAMLARTINEGRAWSSDRNALVVLGIGAFFMVTRVLNASFLGANLWPILLIGAGVYLLYFKDRSPRFGASDKTKRDQTF